MTLGAGAHPDTFHIWISRTIQQLWKMEVFVPEQLPEERIHPFELDLGVRDKGLRGVNLDGYSSKLAVRSV